MAFQNTIIDLEQSQHSIESPPWKEDEKQIDFAQFLLAQHIQIHNKHSLNNQQSNSNHNLEASKEEEKLKNSTKSNQNYSPGRKRFGNKNRKKSLKKWNSGKYKQSSSQAQLSPGLSKKLSLETVLIATRNWEDCEAEKVIIRIFEGELPHELLIVIEEQPVHNPSYQNIKKRNKELTKLSQSNLHAFYQKFNIFQEAFLELKEQTQTQQDPFLKQVNDSLSCLLQESTILKNRLFCLEYYLQNIIRRNQIAKPKSDEINLEKMLVVLENFFPQIRIDNQSIDKVFYNDADKLMYLLISIISNACMCACRFPIRLIVSSTSNAELTLPPNLKRPSSRLSFKTIDIPTRQSDYTNIKRPSDSLFSHSQYNNHKVFDGKQRRIENRQKRLESRHSESAIYNFEEPHYARFQQQQQLSEDTHVEQVQEVDQTDDTPAVPGEVEYQRKQQQNLMDGIPNEKTEQKQHHLIGTFPSDLEEQKKEFLGNLLSDRDDHRRMPQASSSICSNNPQQSMNNTANNINNPNRWDGILFRISFMHEKGVALTNHYNCVEDTESLKIEQKIISRFIKTIGPQNSLLVKSAISLKEISEEREDLLKRTFKLTYDAYMEHFQKYYWMKKEGHFQQEEKRATMQKKEEELVSSDFEMIAYKDILQTTQPVLSLSKPRQSQASLKTLFPITRLKSDDLILRLKTGSSLIPSHFVDNHIQNNNSNIIFHGNMNQMSVNSQDKQGILEKKEEISSNEESQTEILPAVSEEVQYGEITHGLPASLKINKNDQFPIKSFQNRSFQTKGYNQNHIERILDENPSISKQQEEEQLQIVFPISKKILEENNHLERPDSLISARDQLQHLNQTIQRYRTNSGFSDLIQYPKESEQLQSQQILDIGNVFNGYGFTSPTSGQELLGGRQQKQLTPRKKE